ncbi:MAG: iron-sulfur cluster assembly accessory protein [Sedimenticola sp.]
MSETTLLQKEDLSVSSPAQSKMVELVGQVEEEIKGIRVYATPGGCSGISFGMTFTDQINDDDAMLKCEGFDVIVDGNTMQYLRGVEIDFVDQGEGNASFVFNNLQPVSGSSGCGTCGSGSGSPQGGGCS